MHIQWLASAMQSLYGVLFMAGAVEGPEFRGFDIANDKKMETVDQEC